jgi:hypothetical protein
MKKQNKKKKLNGIKADVMLSLPSDAQITKMVKEANKFYTFKEKKIYCEGYRRGLFVMRNIIEQGNGA